MYKTNKSKRSRALRVGSALGTAQQIYNAYKQGRQLATLVRQQFRPRGTGSKTKTRNVPRTVVTKSGHNDQSSTKMTLIVRKQPLKNRSVSTMVYHENYQQIISGSEGRQAADVSRYSAAARSFVSNQTLANDRVGQATAYFNLKPSQFSTGNVGGPLAAGIVRSEIEYLNVHSCYQDMNITNLQSASCTVYIYFFLAKKNSDRSPLEWWDQDCTNLDYSVTANLSRALTTTTTWQTGGTRPTSLPNYPNTDSVKKHYKCMRVKRFELDGGQSHRIRINQIFNRRVERSALTALNDDNYQHVAGLTIVPLIIVQGSPVGISDSAGAVSATEMTTSATKIGIMMSKTWKFSELKEMPYVPTKFTCQGVVAGTAHVYGPRIIDDEDHAVAIERV